MGYYYTVKAALYAHDPAVTHDQLREHLAQLVPGVFEEYPEGHWKHIRCRIVAPLSASYHTVNVLLFEADKRDADPWGMSMWDLSDALEERGLVLEVAHLGDDWDDAACESSTQRGTHVLSLARAIDVDSMEEK